MWFYELFLNFCLLFILIVFLCFYVSQYSLLFPPYSLSLSLSLRSLHCSQKPATGRYPEPAESSSPHRSISPKVYLNIILPPVFRSLQWSLPFGSPNQNPVNTSPLPHAYHMSLPPHPPSFNHPNNIQWIIQAVKFIIMPLSIRNINLNCTANRFK